MRARTVAYAGLAILALAAPVLGLYPVFLMKLLCFAMFACAFNLLLGYTKMLSFGHAAYFGSSAYVTGWLVTAHGWGTIAGILAGVAAALLLGLAIGAIAVRRQGIYFAMITLALVPAGVLRLPAGAVHGRRERPAGHAARKRFRIDRPRPRHHDVLLRAGGLCRRVRVHSPHRALAFRPGSQGDPRE